MKQLPCPRCRKKLGYRDQHIGKRVRCPGCSARFQLAVAVARTGTLKKTVNAPARAAAGQTAAPPRPFRRMRRASHARQRSRTGPSWGVLAGVFVGMVLASGAAICGAQWWRASNRNRALAPVQEKPVAASTLVATSTLVGDSAPFPGKRVGYSAPAGYGGYGGGYGYGNANGEVVLLDHVTSNARVADDALDLAFVNSKGGNRRPAELSGQEKPGAGHDARFPGLCLPDLQRSDVPPHHELF
jgi:DNA-directed RNA polymerase subunit RPC12/RpoP